jgi:hypothetical protein
MGKKENLRKSLIYYLLIPLSIALLISLLLFFVFSYYISVDDILIKPGDYYVNPAVFFGVFLFVFLFWIFLRFDYKLRQLLNLDIKIDDEYIQEKTEQKYFPILDGKIKEEDIWHEIPEKNVKKYLKNLVESVKKFYNVTDVRFYYKNPKYNCCFFSDISLYPFIIYDKYFALCKIDDSIVDEITISKKHLIFINYGYAGEDFTLTYSDEEEKLLSPDQMEGHLSTAKEIEFYNRIRNNQKLLDKIHSTMKKSYAFFWLDSKKRALTFKGFKEHYSKYRNNLLKAEKDFREYEKNCMVAISFNSTFDLKIKPEFFELAKDLLKVILE